MQHFDEMIDAKLRALMSDYYEFEELIKNLPVQVKGEIANVTKDIESLNFALKAIPEQFDADFSQKMNQILDVVAEVDKHTEKLKKTIQADNSVQIEKQASQIANSLNRSIEGYSVTSKLTLMLMFFMSFIGGSVTLIVAAGLYVRMFS